MGANRKDNRQINFRVSEHEYQRLEQMANNVGMSVPMPLFKGALSEWGAVRRRRGKAPAL